MSRALGPKKAASGQAQSSSVAKHDIGDIGSYGALFADFIYVHHNAL